MENKHEPSSEWTIEERIQLASSLALEIQQATVGHNDIGSNFVFDRAERIRLVLTEDTLFLENNREGILTGKIKWRR